MSFELNDLKWIYNQCSQDATFNEAMILHAIEGGSTTVNELKNISLKNGSYIIKTLSALKERGIVKENPGSKTGEYRLTALGLKSLILLKIIADNLIAEKNINTDELVEKIKKFNLDERNLKYIKVCCE